MVVEASASQTAQNRKQAEGSDVLRFNVFRNGMLHAQGVSFPSGRVVLERMTGGLTVHEGDDGLSDLLTRMDAEGLEYEFVDDVSE